MDQRWSDARSSTATAAPADPVRRLSAPECWAHLRRQHEGRLSYLSGRGPRHVMMPYIVRDHELVVQVPTYNEAAQYVAGRRVTFDVVARTGERRAERIEVGGHARVLDPESGDGDALAGHWSAERSSRLICLTVDDVRGETEQVGSGQ